MMKNLFSKKNYSSCQNGIFWFTEKDSSPKNVNVSTKKYTNQPSQEYGCIDAFIVNGLEESMNLNFTSEEPLGSSILNRPKAKP